MRLIQENEQPRTESNSNLRTHDGRQDWPPPDNKAVHKIQFGVSGLKRVAWPPPSSEEHLIEVSPDQVVKAQNSSGPSNYANQSSPRSGYSTPSSQQGLANNYQQPAYQQQHSYQQPPSHQQKLPYQQQHSYQQQQQQPAYQQQGSFSPIQNQTPSSFAPVQQPAKQWSSVSSPTPTSPVPQRGPQYPAQGFQSSSQVFSPSAQSYQNTAPAYPQEQQPGGPSRPQATQPQKQFEPPPQTITLRSEPPMSQIPAPVYNAQPAAKVFKGGKFLRGDLKWPPPEVKQHMAEEQKHLEDLAKGPAFRPRKLEKDYSDFFAQHALNSTYPGYKVPPGTLYYPHEPKYIKLS